MTITVTLLLIGAQAQVPAEPTPLPLMTRGCQFLDFSRLAAGADGAAELAAIGMETPPQPLTPLVVERRIGTVVHRGLLWSPLATADGTVMQPALLSLTRPAHRVALALANGRHLSPISTSEMTQALVTALDADGTTVASTKIPVSDSPSTVALLNTDGDAIAALRIDYGNTNQEEEVAAIGVCRGDLPELPVYPSSAVGNGRKLSAAWLGDTGSGTLRARARIKTGGDVWRQQPDRWYRLSATAVLSDPRGGDALRVLRQSVNVSMAAEPDPCTPFALVNVVMAWDGKDSRGSTVSTSYVNVRLDLVAERVKEKKGGTEQLLHTLDEVSLFRSVAPVAIAGLGVVDGMAMGRALLADPPIDLEEEEEARLAESLRNNPEAASVFLEAALDASSAPSRRIQAMYFLELSRDAESAYLLAPLIDDPNPSIAAAARDLIDRAAQGWPEESSERADQTSASVRAALCGSADPSGR